MRKIERLKNRLFAIIGGLIFILILIILMFNIGTLKREQQRERESHQESLQRNRIEMNTAMKRIEDMLISQDIEDTAMQNIRRPRKEIDRYLALLEKRDFFAEEIGKYRLLDGLFLYDKNEDTYVGVKGGNVSVESHTAVRNFCKEIVEKYEESETPSDWHVLKIEEEYYIFRLVNWKEIYYCAWLKPENMVAGLRNAEHEAEYFFLSDPEGNILNREEGADIDKLSGSETTIHGEKYEILSENQKERGKLVLSYVYKKEPWTKAASQMIVPTVLVLIMGGFALFLVLVLTSEIIVNPLYGILVEEERKKNQAQLQFLQIQTNPHFLNNCLSLIRNLILLDRKKEAEKVTLMLGKFTRGSLCSQTEIPLKKEMEQVQAYYELQKIRYGERLMLDVYMDDNVENILIPAMAVQTFVENSVKHQMKTEGTLFILVWVCFNEEKRQVNIRIKDNGEGFSESVLRQLRENIPVKKEGSREEENREHIGIQNLVQRMKILYDNQASIQFENAGGKENNPESKGAVVTMIFPEKRITIED